MASLSIRLGSILNRPNQIIDYVWWSKFLMEPAPNSYQKIVERNQIISFSLAWFTWTKFYQIDLTIIDTLFSYTNQNYTMF